MRQVPYYLLIGNGRMSRHMQHYFSLLGLSFATWQRQEPEAKLQQQLQHATHILLLISDHAIEEFNAQKLKNSSAMRLHFSGSLLSEQVYGVHPLMTFNPQLYDFEKYQSVSFVIDHNAPDFAELLPGVPNPHVRLHQSFKAKYHALCVMSGNFSCLLWQKLFTSLEQEFNLPASIAHSYLQQVTQNLIQDSASALTGPLVRNDINTINKNLQALQADPFAEVYASFVACYQKLKQESPI